jgi:hypothetical protein
MKSIILLSVCIIGFISCDSSTKYENSGTLHEDAIVVTLINSPAEHKTEIKSTMYDHDNGFTATDYNGNTGIKIGEDLQLSQTEIKARYGAVFQCNHGTFTVEGTELKHKILYDKLIRSIGDTVDILYQEQYRVTYGKKEGSDKIVKLNSVLEDLDFIDAQIKH